MVEIRFERPPVREVVLTVWFEPLPTMRTLDLAALRQDWMEDLPNLEEAPPFAPWRDKFGASSTLLMSDDKWPVPACLFSSDDRERQVLIQNDRLSLSWHFEVEENLYPGFTALVAELEARYGQFATSIEAHDNPTPVVGRVSIDYTNRFDGVAGDSFAAYLLTGSSNVRDTRPGSDVVVLRRHYCADEENSFTTVNLTLDSSDHSDDHASEKEADTRRSILRISGMADVEPEEDLFARLRDAHREALSVFLNSVDDDVRSSWGPIDG